MKQNKRNIIIGITGRIATGKSTFSRIFESKGFVLHDADAIYKRLFNESPEMRAQIVQYFKTLDKQKILEEITKSRESLGKLNEITHVHVTHEILHRLEIENEEDHVLDVPIPVDEGFIDVCDYIIATDCPAEVQLERLALRNGFTREEAMKRMSLQMDREDYFKIADFIVNTENMSERQSNETVEMILRSIGWCS
ncbi:MAG TPA: dephospho-CoA kinase [Clostridia bacterium]|nr:dephospho-CoA kinase [Clostridia bacterium]HRX41975.1 dephospho-CoA kinase [Clostridia bacterium]